jgi:hypothetical protein
MQPSLEVECLLDFSGEGLYYLIGPKPKAQIESNRSSYNPKFITKGNENEMKRTIPSSAPHQMPHVSKFAKYILLKIYGK